MKRIFGLGLSILMISTASGALAQSHDYGRGDDRETHRDDRREDRGGDRYGRHEWREGGRIERRDWARGNRIDYRARHLRRPPRGYEWREVDGNFILAAVATGVIASIIINSAR